MADPGPNAILRAYSNRLRDIFPLEMNHKLSYFIDYCHPSEAGTTVIARQLFAFMSVGLSP